jgi:hypothetical protein
MEDLSIALVWLGFFACIFFGLYFYFSARHKERMALIEKNADVSEIFKVRKFQFRFPWLKLGMIFLSVGFGLIAVVILANQPEIQNLPQDLLEMLAMGTILIFGGIGLVIGYFIEKPKNH